MSSGIFFPHPSSFLASQGPPPPPVLRRQLPPNMPVYTPANYGPMPNLGPPAGFAPLPPAPMVPYPPPQMQPPPPTYPPGYAPAAPPPAKKRLTAEEKVELAKARAEARVAEEVFGSLNSINDLLKDDPQYKREKAKKRDTSTIQLSDDEAGTSKNHQLDIANRDTDVIVIKSKKRHERLFDQMQKTQPAIRITDECQELLFSDKEITLKKTKKKKKATLVSEIDDTCSSSSSTECKPIKLTIRRVQSTKDADEPTSSSSIVERPSMMRDFHKAEWERELKKTKAMVDLMTDDADDLMDVKPGPSDPTKNSSAFDIDQFLATNQEESDDIPIPETAFALADNSESKSASVSPNERHSSTSSEVEVVDAARPLFNVPKPSCSGNCACGGIPPNDTTIVPDPEPTKTGVMCFSVPVTWLQERDFVLSYKANVTETYVPQHHSACGFMWEGSVQVERSQRTCGKKAVGLFLTAGVETSILWMSWDLKYKYAMSIKNWKHDDLHKRAIWHEVETGSGKKMAMGVPLLTTLDEILAPNSPFVRDDMVSFRIEFEVLETKGLYDQKRWMFRPITNPMTDIIVTTKEGMRSAAPRQYLAYHSDYFRRMFYSGFRESMVKEIRLLSLRQAEFMDFLKFILPGRVPLTPENIERITFASYYLMADDVRAECDFYLCNVKDCEVPLANKVRLAARYDLRQLKRQIGKWLTRRADIEIITKSRDYEEWESGIKAHTNESDMETDVASIQTN